MFAVISDAGADKARGGDALQPADRSAAFTLCAGAQPSRLRANADAFVHPDYLRQWLKFL